MKQNIKVTSINVGKSDALDNGKTYIKIDVFLSSQELPCEPRLCKFSIALCKKSDSLYKMKLGEKVAEQSYGLDANPLKKDNGNPLG